MYGRCQLHALTQRQACSTNLQGNGVWHKGLSSFLEESTKFLAKRWKTHRCFDSLWLSSLWRCWKTQKQSISLLFLNASTCLLYQSIFFRFAYSIYFVFICIKVIMFIFTTMLQKPKLLLESIWNIYSIKLSDR